jgi:hypothetical protein
VAYWAGASVVLWAAWVLWVGTTGWLTLDSALFGLVAMSGAWLWGAVTGLVVALVVMASTISRAGPAAGGADFGVMGVDSHAVTSTSPR